MSDILPGAKGHCIIIIISKNNSTINFDYICYFFRAFFTSIFPLNNLSSHSELDRTGRIVNLSASSKGGEEICLRSHGLLA